MASEWLWALMTFRKASFPARENSRALLMVRAGARLELRQQVLDEQLHVSAPHLGGVLRPVAGLQEFAELMYGLR
jgi:hypothetical protein